MLLSYFIGQHYNPIHYPVKSILGYFAVALAIFAAMNCVKFPSEWLTLTVNTLLILVYLSVVLYNERALVNKIIKKLKG